MEWDGIADSTLFNITIFPAAERCRVDQLLAFSLIRSTIDAKRSRLRRPKCSGNPKYLPTPPSFSISKTSLTANFREAGVFLEKVMADFCVLIVWPDASWYRVKMALSVSLLVLFALRKTLCRPQIGDGLCKVLPERLECLRGCLLLVHGYIVPRGSHCT